MLLRELKHNFWVVGSGDSVFIFRSHSGILCSFILLRSTVFCYRAGHRRYRREWGRHMVCPSGLDIIRPIKTGVGEQGSRAPLFSHSEKKRGVHLKWETGETSGERPVDVEVMKQKTQRRASAGQRGCDCGQQHHVGKWGRQGKEPPENVPCVPNGRASECCPAIDPLV